MTSPTGYPYRSIFAWIAALVVVWLALCSPWTIGWNIFAGLLAVIGAAAAIFIATRRAVARTQATQQVLRKIDTALSGLPSEIRRNTPLVIVIASTDTLLAGVFSADAVRVTDTAIWVRVNDPTRLAHFADALKRWRDGQGPDAVAYLIDADAATDHATLVGGLRRWRAAIGEANRAVGYALPVCVAMYANESASTADECPWFGVSGVDQIDVSTLHDAIATRLGLYAGMAIPQDREARAHRAARLDVLTQWTAAAILPVLLDSQRTSRSLQIHAFGVVAVEGHPAKASLLARYATDRTKLVLPDRGTNLTGTPARYTLPAPLIRGIATQHAHRPMPRALAHGFIALVALFCAAAASSAWQNRNLVERVRADMAQYAALAPGMDEARIDALSIVKRDRDQLAAYASNGLPPRLGLGFYRASALLPGINTLIASYQPPAPPPSMIELDSLSLFKSGSAVLNPGSNRVLVGAVELIKANAAKRVLIAGHTDNVGNAASNRTLSEARAASVRDWLADASGISPTRFAIQGYGDTRPKASNETEAGRAANRRVEITLVPDCRDDRKNGASPEGHEEHRGNVACSFN
ncbi:flagellar motor protein MotB [Burkholderia sp. Leaf177]|uniref:OmpA family protein n=1 Tax=Burkholderia sp. Leaf177 TaxID=1736287 RepID=UPI0006FC3E64|nr:OmpA family protein [Burkholderia sp. Leaf177]KQR78922.1 flagellar motor protein MotB [Burkholderia sp. Leaf177]